MEQWKAFIICQHYHKVTPREHLKQVKAAIKKPPRDTCILVQLNFLASAIIFLRSWCWIVSAMNRRCTSCMSKWWNSWDISYQACQGGCNGIRQSTWTDNARCLKTEFNELWRIYPKRTYTIRADKAECKIGKSVLQGVRSLFSAVSNFIQTKFPLSKKLLQLLSCLNPERIKQTSTLWWWLPLRLSKRQSTPTTILLRTTLQTRTITQTTTKQTPLLAIENVAKQIHIPDNEVSYVSRWVASICAW